MMFKKLWLLASLVAVMSLTTGVAFGHWTTVANVNSTIQTGTACTEIVGNPFQLDNGPDWTLQNNLYPLNLVNNSLVNTGQNIGHCTLSLVDGNLYIVMSNMYPTYANEFSFDVYNCGTVPMEISNVQFICVNNTAANTLISTQKYFTLDLNGDGKPDVEIIWAGAIGNTLCPGSIPLENSFYIHFLEPVPEHCTFVLEVHVDFQSCES